MGTESSPSAALELIGVTAAYGRDAPVLERVTLSAYAGELTHVVGGNGSGKSTIAELASGYLRPRVGRVLVQGIRADDARARARRRVCRTSPALYGEMTAHDHLVLASRFAGTPPAEALDRFDAYGGGAWIHRAAGQLSVGNARKLWIVMTTLGSFNLVVLDESFEGLDDEGADVLRTEIQRWRSSGAVVLITHRLPPNLTVDRVLHIGGPGAGVQRPHARGAAGRCS